MNLDRRHFIAGTVAGTFAATTFANINHAEPAMNQMVTKQVLSPRICINTSTIRDAKIPLEKIIPMIKGYHSIEPWINEIDAFVKSGGKLFELKKQIEGAGLIMESAIGFPQWGVDDEAQRAKGFEEAKRCMDLVAQLGGKKLAAPPAGINSPSAPVVSLDALGERYAQLLELGEKMGVIPQLEIWGPSKNLSKVSEAIYVATASGHPQARLLLDVYHIFRGGSSFHSLKLIAGSAMDHFHINDFPAKPPRLEQKDADRVYPGEGVGPLVELVSTMLLNGYQGAFSLELFNKEYYKDEPQVMLDKGFEKTKTVIDKAVAHIKNVQNQHR